MLLLGAVASGAPVASSIHGQEMMFKNITPYLKSINLDSIERVELNGSGQIAFSLSSVDSVEVGDRLIVWSEHP